MADESLKAFLNEGTSSEATTQSSALAEGSTKGPEAASSAAPAADQTPVVTGAPPAPGQQAQEQSDKGEVGPIPYDRFKKELDKRHELEREAAELRGRLSVHERSQTPEQKPQEKKPTTEERFYTEGHKLIDETREGFEGRVSVVERKFGFALSEVAARQKHNDYDAKKQAFEGALKTSLQAGDHTLLMKLQQSSDPAGFVYETGAMIADMQGIGSPAEYRAKVEKDVRAEIETKLRKELALESAANVSTTNAGARSTGGTTAPAAPRDIPDKDIFRGAMR